MIRDLIIDNNVDILCLNETWLSETDTPVITALVPDTHSFYHFPRDNGQRGGGVGVVIDKFFTNVKSYKRVYQYFECLEVRMKINSTNIQLFSIYRPPRNFSEFLSEFEFFLLETRASNNCILFVGDFNVWIDDLTNSDARRFCQVLDHLSLKNYINDATYDSGHTLDLVISDSTSEALCDFFVEPVCTISDHRLISFTLNVSISLKHEKISKIFQFNFYFLCE